MAGKAVFDDPLPLRWLIRTAPRRGVRRLKELRPRIVRYGLVPPILMAFIAEQIWLLIPAVRAGFGDGRLGNLTIESCASGKGTWECSGTFLSDDHAVYAYVTMDMSSHRPGNGQQIRALYPGGGDDWVYPPNGSFIWILQAIIVAGLIGLLVWWVVRVPLRDWESRERAPVGSSAEPSAAEAREPREPHGPVGTRRRKQAPLQSPGTRQRHQPRRR